MPNEGEALARTIIGIIGNVISFGMFISPVHVFKRICKNKSTEGFHPYPYLATTMNCLLWGFYGLPIVHPDRTLVVTINGIGLALEACYLSIFFYYTTKKYRVAISLGLLGEAIALTGIVCATLLCFHTHEERSMVVGIICVYVGIPVYASPLSIMETVIQTNNAGFLPFWLCFACFLNGITWFTYAHLKTFDLYLSIGHGLGGFVGACQLIVYYIYCDKTSGKDDAKPGEVQPQDKDLPPV